MYFCYGIKKSNLESLMEERIELKIPTEGFTLSAPVPPQRQPSAEEISAKLAEVANGRLMSGRQPAPSLPLRPGEQLPNQHWQTFD